MESRLVAPTMFRTDEALARLRLLEHPMADRLLRAMQDFDAECERIARALRVASDHLPP